MTTRMPPPVELGHSFTGTLRRVMTQRNDFNLEFDNPTGLRTVMGFALPEGQRGLVWTDDQKMNLPHQCRSLEGVSPHAAPAALGPAVPAG